MKIPRSYIICMTIIVLAGFAISLRMPRRFIWNSTFLPDDRQPLGCYVFDSVMKSSMPNGYEVCRKTLSQILADSATGRENVLLVSTRLDMTSADFMSMDQLLRGGSRVMVVTDCNTTRYVDSTIAYDYHVALEENRSFSISEFKSHLTSTERNRGDTIRWTDKDPIYSSCKYMVLSQLVSATMILDHDQRIGDDFMPLAFYQVETEYPAMQSPYFPSRLRRMKEEARKRNVDITDLYDSLLVDNTDGNSEYSIVDAPVAVRRSVGKGELIVVSTPLLFTNYGVLTPGLSPLLMRFMSQIADRKVVRTISYNTTDGEYDAGQSPLHYVLSQPPLRAAWYMAAFVLLLFIVFKARRRQRVIPVVTPPKNHSLEFAKLVGTLYCRRGDTNDIIRKKFNLLADTLRASFLVDATDQQQHSETVDVIVRRTSLQPEWVDSVITRLRSDCEADKRLSDGEMEWAIDTIDKIKKLI